MTQVRLAITPLALAIVGLVAVACGPGDAEPIGPLPLALAVLIGVIIGVLATVIFIRLRCRRHP
jgi:hypothetical protein